MSIRNKAQRMEARERLIDSLAKRKGVSREEAKKIYEEFLAEVRSAKWVELSGNVNITLPEGTMIVIAEDSTTKKYSVAVSFGRIL